MDDDMHELGPENLLFSEEELFDQIVDEGMAQGVNTKEAYDVLVEETIEDLRRIGELHDDQNLEGHETALKARFHEYTARMAQGVDA